MRDIPNIVEFATDPQLLGLTLSPAQETLLRAIYGLDLDETELDLWRLCTGREAYPAKPFSEVTVIAGARAGKDSRIATPVLCFEAAFGQHEQQLAKGERAVYPLVAQDRNGAAVAFGYTRSYFTESPLLRKLVDDVFTSELRLTSGSLIQTYPCTLRSLRAVSVPSGILDEVAFYRLEGSADADVEIQTSVRRGMLGFPSPRLVKISTPYMRSGVLHNDFVRGYGTDDPDLLVWVAPTQLMNPTITAERLERERRLDPALARRSLFASSADPPLSPSTSSTSA